MLNKLQKLKQLTYIKILYKNHNQLLNGLGSVTQPNHSVLDRRHTGFLVSENLSNLCYDCLKQLKIYTILTNNQFYKLHIAIKHYKDISGISLMITKKL